VLVSRDALVQWHHQNALYDAIAPGILALPVVAETCDGVLTTSTACTSDEHLFAAIEQASSGPC
jgi:hypothetical protein